VKHELVREHVPTELLASKEIWEQLFRKMPMMAMLRSLGKMSSLELLTSGSFEEELVVSKLKSTIAKDASNALIPDDPKTGLCIDALTSTANR
jgi:hypothetical protein